jgi:glycosyltransferase involved in cell wall biosynthesis
MRPEDVFVARSGPDLSRLKPVDPVPAWKNGRPFMVGYVGVIGQQEGIDLLLEAVRHLIEVEQRTDIQFVLVGGGPALADLRRMATALRLDDYVTFTGRVPDETLFEVLSTADVCVNPDRVNPMNDKSTMNKIMEYMAFGKPIVQFDVTEGRVSAQEASLYAAPNDPMDLANHVAALLADPDRRARMGAYGRQRVHEHLSWSMSVPPLIAAYQKILNL